MLLQYRYFQKKIIWYGNAKYLQNTYTLETQKVPKTKIELKLILSTPFILGAQIGLSIGQYINKGTFKISLVALLVINGITMITTGAMDYYFDYQFYLEELEMSEF